MSRSTSQPSDNGSLNSAAEADQIKTRVDQVKNTFAGAKAATVGFVRRKPVFSAITAGVLALAGLVYGLSGSSKGVPVAEAGLPAAQASKIKESGQTKEVDIVVGSYRKTDRMVILNNNVRYQDATMSVVIDLVACPELATINFRALKGKTVHAKGQFQTYDNKPQVKVTNASDLTIDPKTAETAKK